MDDQVLVLFTSQNGFEHAINHGVDDVFLFRHGLFLLGHLGQKPGTINQCLVMGGQQEPTTAFSPTVTPGMTTL